jgi:hypothetical protein
VLTAEQVASPWKRDVSSAKAWLANLMTALPKVVIQPATGAPAAGPDIAKGLVFRSPAVFLMPLSKTLLFWDGNDTIRSYSIAGVAGPTYSVKGSLPKADVLVLERITEPATGSFLVRFVYLGEKWKGQRQSLVLIQNGSIRGTYGTDYFLRMTREIQKHPVDPDQVSLYQDGTFVYAFYRESRKAEMDSRSVIVESFTIDLNSNDQAEPFSASGLAVDSWPETSPFDPVGSSFPNGIFVVRPRFNSPPPADTNGTGDVHDLAHVRAFDLNRNSTQLMWTLSDEEVGECFRRTEKEGSCQLMAQDGDPSSNYMAILIPSKMQADDKNAGLDPEERKNRLLLVETSTGKSFSIFADHTAGNDGDPLGLGRRMRDPLAGVKNSQVTMAGSAGSAVIGLQADKVVDIFHVRDGRLWPWGTYTSLESNGTFQLSPDGNTLIWRSRTKAMVWDVSQPSAVMAGSLDGVDVDLLVEQATCKVAGRAC